MDTLGRACVRGHGSFLPARRYFDRGHEHGRCRVMHHMSVAGNAAEYAVRDGTMQHGGLLSLDISIVRACHQNHRHGQPAVSTSQRMSGRDHERGFSPHQPGSEMDAQPSLPGTPRTSQGPGLGRKSFAEETATSICSREGIWCGSKYHPATVWRAPTRPARPHERSDNSTPRSEPCPRQFAEASAPGQSPPTFPRNVRARSLVRFPSAQGPH